MKSYMVRTKVLLYLIVMTFCVIFPSLIHADYIINIDFNGKGAVYGPNPTYQAVGYAGGGTTWNGMLIDSSGGDNDLTISGSDLLDSDGVATSVDYTMDHVGGNLNANRVHSDPTFPYAVLDYLYTGTGYGGAAGPATFTITGLGSATSVDIYFHADTNVGGCWVGTPANFFVFEEEFISGEPVLGLIYKATATVVDGQVSGGLVSEGGNVVGYGMAIDVHEIPEPATMVLISIGGGLSLLRRKR